MQLILCSDNFNKIPYTFKMTGINVYSTEEVLWHIFNYFEESVYVFEDNAFYRWAEGNLGLNKEIKLLKETEKELNEKIIDFLKCFKYFNADDISCIEQKLYKLNDINSFDKQKRAGDLYYKKGNYQQAVYAYSKALETEPKKAEIIKNNIGLCCMQAGDYENGINFLKQSYEKNKNTTVLSNLIQCCVLGGFYEKADNFLKSYLEEDTFEYKYLKSIIYLSKGEYNSTISVLKECLNIKYDIDIVIKISDILIKQRKFEDAAAFLESIDKKEAEIYVKLSEIYCASQNYSLGIKAAQKGIIFNVNEIRLWIILAKCYRLSLNFSMADGAICKAMQLDKNNPEVILELARLRKSEGKTDYYKDCLNKGLEIIKKKYFESC